MPPVDPHAHPPRFRLWLRRLAVAESPYALRFEVQDGKGILRVPRPGVLIDPPARQIGMEERLTLQQLRGTRFILVWDGGRARQGHALSQLDEGTLERVEEDRWVELEVTVDAGFRHLVVPLAAVSPVVSPPRRGVAARPSLTELRQALDSLTTRSEDDDDPDSALDLLTGPSPGAPPAAAAGDGAPARVERTEVPVPVDPPLISTEAPNVRVPATHEVIGPRGRKPRRRLAETAPTVVSDAESVPEPRSLGARGPATTPPPVPVGPPPREPAVVEPEPPAEAEALALGEADEADDDAMALALGEADEADDDAMALALGEADEADDDAMALALGGASESPPEPAPPARPPVVPGRVPPVRAPHAAPPGDSAAPLPLAAGFTDDDEEAAFSIDLPSHRRSTEYVNVLGQGDDRHTTLDGSFAREELPPIEELALPADDASPEARGNGVFDQPDAPPRPSGRATGGRRGAPVVPTGAGPSDAAPDDAYRATSSLVRHLRRQTEEQRRRISELEEEIAELRARLAGTPGGR